MSNDGSSQKKNAVVKKESAETELRIPPRYGGRKRQELGGYGLCPERECDEEAFNL